MFPEQHLSLLEMLAGEIAPACRLEQGQVPAGLLISLLFQPCQRACPEEHLSEKQPGKSRRLNWGGKERGTGSWHREPAGWGVWTLVQEEPENPLAQGWRGRSPSMAPGDGPGPGGRLWVWRSEVGSLTSKEKRQQHRGRGATWDQEEQEALTGQTRREGPSAKAVILSLCPVPRPTAGPEHSSSHLGSGGENLRSCLWGKTRVGGEASALLPTCSASFQLPPLSCQGPTPTPTFHTLMKKLRWA